MPPPARTVRTRTGAVVVDASVALKWVIDEEGSDQAARLLDGRPLHAPALLLTEAANALWVIQRRGTIDAGGAEDALQQLRAAPLVMPPSDIELIGEAFRIARLLDHPVYDCVYLALAVERGAPVVTADRRLVAAAAKDPDLATFIRKLSDI